MRKKKQFTIQDILNFKFTKHTQSKILDCKCGNKYIKTRPDQETCLYCIHGRPPMKM